MIWRHSHIRKRGFRGVEVSIVSNSERVFDRAFRVDHDLFIRSASIRSGSGDEGGFRSEFERVEKNG